MILLKKKAVNGLKEAQLTQNDMDILSSLGRADYRKARYEGLAVFEGLSSPHSVSASVNMKGTALVIDVVSGWYVSIPLKHIVKVTADDKQILFVLKHGKLVLYK
jgi:hypothetical protein